jgi:hypothetical protein
VRPRAFAVFVALLTILHFLLHAGLGIARAAPDLLAVAVLLAARRTTAMRAVLLALLLGVLDDALGIRNLGARSIALGVAAIAGTWTRRLIEGEGPLLIVPYLFAGKWLIDVVVAMLLPAMARDGSPHALLVSSPLDALYVAVAGTVALAAFRVVMGPDS